MGTTDKTAAERQRRLRERRAKELTECRALQTVIEELIKDSELTDAEKWQALLETQKPQPWGFIQGFIQA